MTMNDHVMTTDDRDQSAEQFLRLIQESRRGKFKI